MCATIPCMSGSYRVAGLCRWPVSGRSGSRSREQGRSCRCRCSRTPNAHRARTTAQHRVQRRGSAWSCACSGSRRSSRRDRTVWTVAGAPLPTDLEAVFAPFNGARFNRFDVGQPIGLHPSLHRRCPTLVPPVCAPSSDASRRLHLLEHETGIVGTSVDLF
jgi:hypothetical protein